MGKAAAGHRQKVNHPEESGVRCSLDMRFALLGTKAFLSGIPE